MPSDDEVYSMCLSVTVSLAAFAPLEVTFIATMHHHRNNI